MHTEVHVHGDISLKRGAGSAEIESALRPWLEYVFQQGQDQTTEPGTNMVLFLASGKADSLSGRLFMVPDDPADLVSRADEIRQKDLFTLRLRHPKI